MLGDDEITVGLIEDDPEIRRGWATLIAGEPGFHCTFQCGSMEQALEQLQRDRPRVLLVDIGLPGLSGIEGIRIIHEQYPELLLLVLTVYRDDERIFNALCAGAVGYMLKSTPRDRLIESMREVAAGGAPMSPEIARRVIALFRHLRPVAAKADYDLTPYETRVLRLLVAGHSYKSAASELNVSVNTISFHTKQIYGKLQVHSKSQAVAKALQQGLVR